MKVQLTTILLICFEHVSKAIAQGMPISPCPKIFQYRFDGNEWFGLIAVRNPDVKQALHLRVTLSMRGKPTTNYLGEIELLTRGQFTNHAPILYKIRFPKHHFPPKLILISANNHVICFGSGEHSIFMTQIQLEHIRKVTFIGDKKITAGGGKEFDLESMSGIGGKEMAQTHKPHIQFKKKPFHSPREICGKTDSSLDFRLPQRSKHQSHSRSGDVDSSVSSSPIFASLDDYDEIEHMVDEEEDLDVEEEEVDDGTVTVNTLPSITRGSWPWLAAIYVNNLTSLDFQCGGTLISRRVVISSAHCFKMFNQRYTANEVLVFLGRHNLKNWNEEGSLAAPVDGIYIHPDYKSQLTTYDADIVVIMLKDEVRFNTFIRPACLWVGSSKSEYIVGEHGIVIGWSFDKSNASKPLQSPAPSVSVASKTHFDGSIPKIVKAPIVANEVCFKANSHFRSLSSNRTFCAGILVEDKHIQQHVSGGNGASFYTGISGAGLMIFKNNRWMLRGTVSAALPAKFAESGTTRINQETRSSSPMTCCNNQYIIYADVAKFIDWIMAFVI